MGLIVKIFKESGYLCRDSDGLRAGLRGFNSQQGNIFLTFTASGTHPASYAMGTGSCFSLGKAAVA
jgi:hypothetical protein